MKPKLFWLGLLVSLSTSFTLAFKAEAGAIDKPTPESTTSDKPFASVITTPKFKIWGNWKIWSQPYLLNGNICREKAGNLICLNPQQAKNTRWNITSKIGN